MLVITGALSILLYSGAMLRLSPLFTAALTAICAANFIISRSVFRYEEAHRDNHAELEKKLGYIENIASDLQSAKDVRIYSMKNWILEIRGGIMRDYLSLRVRIAHRRFAWALISFAIYLIRDVGSVACLIYMFSRNAINAGDLVFYFGVVAAFSGTIGVIAWNLHVLSNASSYINDMRDFLEQPDAPGPERPAALPERPAAFPYATASGQPVELQAASVLERSAVLPERSAVLPERSTALLKRPAALPERPAALPERPAALPGAPLFIEFKDVCFSYGDASGNVLNNFSLSVRAGEKVALVGINGAGKTTIVKLLCGLYKPDSGVIEINGTDISYFRKRDLLTLFSAVFQDISLFAFTVAENVSMKPAAETNERRVADCLEKAGLLDEIMKYKDGLRSWMMKDLYKDGIIMSGGQQQKLLMARALYKDAPILILDEPTAALDPIAESQVYEHFHELSLNKTAIYISHRLASTRFCDKIAFLKGGEITEIGNHYELMGNNGDYAEMYEIQSHYYKKDGENETRNKAYDETNRKAAYDTAYA
jgi:ABC-type multidrug transport system fused ATPase/permease subunit